MHQPVPGQRWVSDTEPELGLGIILKAEFGRVEILFPAANEHRQYALKTAALRRVEFKDGDRIKTHDGTELVVDSIEERKGLFVYLAGGREVAEAELSDHPVFQSRRAPACRTRSMICARSRCEWKRSRGGAGCGSRRCAD